MYLMFQGEAIRRPVDDYQRRRKLSLALKKAVLGPDLMDQFEAQARRFGAEMIAADVTRVDFSSRPYRALDR